MSLNARIALWGAIVLALFMLLTGFALENAFRESARSSHQERLQGQLYLLISAAEPLANGIAMPDTLAESRFSLPDSGLYAAISDAEGNLLWRSESVSGRNLPFVSRLQPGMRQFSSSNGYFVESMGVRWGEAGHRYTFSVAEDLKEYEAQIVRYRRSLEVRLGIMSALLLLTQAAVLRWGLSPLRRVSSELEEIGEGKRDSLGKYPSELNPLTESLNRLLLRERARQMRYRDALADLAHSLKTPLAVMRAAVGSPELKETVIEEVAKMDRIVGYQLQRASAVAPSGLSAPVGIRPMLEKIAASLSKVYFEKKIEVSVVAEGTLACRVDEGDIMEMMGNLADNAFKWCAKRVRLGAFLENGRLVMSVEDDGPGMPEHARIMERGMRADETVPGHGIGLAVVKDIAEAYHGSLEAGRSDLGGARLKIVLPLN